MVEYRDRLLSAMNERGVSASELADKLGMTYQAVKKVLDGKSAAFNAVNHALVARYLGVRSDWLALGEEPIRVEDPPHTRPWLFPSLDEEKVMTLSHDDLVRLDAALLFAASQVGLKRIVREESAA